jgi:hypothetical protein
MIPLTVFPHSGSYELRLFFSFITPLESKDCSPINTRISIRGVSPSTPSASLNEAGVGRIVCWITFGIATRARNEMASLWIPFSHANLSTSAYPLSYPPQPAIQTRFVRELLLKPSLQPPQSRRLFHAATNDSKAKIMSFACAREMVLAIDSAALLLVPLLFCCEC